jgi:hypothetical protein
MSEDINRNPSDYDANIRSILHSAPGRAFSLDEISVYISTNIDGEFDRHYLRNRLFYYCKIGRFANPIRNHYQVAKPNPERSLDIDTCWDEFVQNAKDYVRNMSLYTDQRGRTWRISQIRDDGENEYLELVSSEVNGIVEFTFEHFQNAIIRINASGGEMESPDRRYAHRATICELVNDLNFDSRGYTVVARSESTSVNQEDTTNNRENTSIGGMRRVDGEWNVRRKRAVFESDYEPQTIDSEHRISLTIERTERHENLVDFVWFEWLGDDFDRREGEFDLLCKNSNFPRILWEMKTIQLGDLSDEKRQVTKAVSQLLYYDYNLGDTGIHPLVACFEYEISPSLQRFLSSCGIHCCWKSGNRLLFGGDLTPPSCLVNR